MINFYPGPSKVHPSVQQHFNTAFENGLLSYNHRSDVFSGIIKETYASLKQHLNIPNGYHIAFTSSATECWEIVIQNFVKNNALHIYNGAFGEKWSNYTQQLKGIGDKLAIPYNQAFASTELPLKEYDTVCLTHCETSNGTSLKSADFKRVRATYHSSIIAVDATSSMAGVAIDFSQADIWFASIQKCFGLPAGMAVMVYSEKCLNHITQTEHYNNFESIHKNSVLHQTTHTPNTLGILLLNEVCKELPNSQLVEKRIVQQANEWYHFFENNTSLTPLISLKENRSETVICLLGNETDIKSITSKALEAGFVLGKGYGEHKTTSLRIANFPAIEEHEISALKTFFSSF